MKMLKKTSQNRNGVTRLWMKILIGKKIYTTPIIATNDF